MNDPKQRVKHFFTKIAGVTHRNQDGTNRQRIIERCKLLEKLILEHEEDNPVDPNAIKICRENGQQLGYLNADLAPRVVRESNEGYRFAAFISDLTGGRREAPTRGVNLLVVVANPGVTDREAQDYVDSLLTDLPYSPCASVFGNLADNMDEFPRSPRRYVSRRDGEGTDAPGVISLIFGCLAVLCLLMGCFTCGATYYAAVPFALLGGLVGFFGRGNMRVAGLLLNFLALIPAIAVMLGVLGMIGLGSSAAVALKNQETTGAEPSGDGSQTITRNETINKANVSNQSIVNPNKSSLQSAGKNSALPNNEERRQPAEERQKAEQKANTEAEREVSRQIELEKSGLPYYPPPQTLKDGRNAEEWYQLLRSNSQKARIFAQATAALSALKEEGIPFLLDYLSRQTTLKSRQEAVRLIRVECVHRNDLPKLLPCLEQSKNDSFTRLLALEGLEKRAKDLKKEHIPQIENLVKDMLENPRYSERTKEEIQRRLETIRMEANALPANRQR